MKFCWNRNFLPIVLLQLWLSVHLTLSSSLAGGDLLPPIPRWQESWTASQAHGTAMAMVVGDSAVLVLRSPSSDVYKPSLTHSSSQLLDGLEVEPMDDASQQLQYAPSWFPIGSHTLCAMTGLALDVEHVCRVLQNINDDNFYVYQESMRTGALTLELASILQEECLSKGGRPYGIQCLLVGCDTDDDSSSSSLCMYSMDPTGTWQSWGRATAIGKFGTDVRRILAQKLKQFDAVTKLEEAVECLLSSWKETCQDLGIDKKEKEDCQVLVLRKQESGRPLLFRVCPEEVDRIMDKVEAAIAANGQ